MQISNRALNTLDPNNTGAWRIVKSKILMKLTVLENVEDVDGKSSLKVIDSKIFKMSGKEFRMSLAQDEAAGIKHTVEIVNEAPEKFQINVIYILADGRKAWAYTMKDDLNN